jgi:hypothetical protein
MCNVTSRSNKPSDSLRRSGRGKEIYEELYNYSQVTANGNSLLIRFL